MFRISRRLDYGVQLMIALASETENKPVPSARLAENLQIPLPFLHQIGHMLMQAGLIKASPGPRGGLRLAQPAEDISILKIVETLEGNICMNDCLECGNACPRQDTCTARPVWGRLQENISEYMANVPLSSLVRHPVELPLYTLQIPQHSEKLN
jgi:Rrf2 family protein